MLSGRAIENIAMEEFPGSWQGFELLRRLVFRGNLRNFNVDLAAELIADGLAVIQGEELVATALGIEVERSILRWPRPVAA